MKRTPGKKWSVFLQDVLANFFWMIIVKPFVGGVRTLHVENQLSEIMKVSEAWLLETLMSLGGRFEQKIAEKEILWS